MRAASTQLSRLVASGRKLVPSRAYLGLSDWSISKLSASLRILLKVGWSTIRFMIDDPIIVDLMNREKRNVNLTFPFCVWMLRR